MAGLYKTANTTCVIYIYMHINTHLYIAQYNCTTNLHANFCLQMIYAFYINKSVTVNCKLDRPSKILVTCRGCTDGNDGATHFVHRPEQRT